LVSEERDLDVEDGRSLGAEFHLHRIVKQWPDRAGNLVRAEVVSAQRRMTASNVARLGRLTVKFVETRWPSWTNPTMSVSAVLLLLTQSSFLLVDDPERHVVALFKAAVLFRQGRIPATRRGQVRGRVLSWGASR
jgi:hypothetical protein